MGRARHARTRPGALLAAAAALLVLSPAGWGATWALWRLEADTIATAWWIARHADPDARFVHRSAPAPGGGATIGGPDGRYRRSGLQTALDMAMARHPAPDEPCAEPLSKAIRLIELAPWRVPAVPDAAALQAALAAPLAKADVDAALAALDHWCRTQGSRR